MDSKYQKMLDVDSSISQNAHHKALAQEGFHKKINGFFLRSAKNDDRK